MYVHHMFCLGRNTEIQWPRSSVDIIVRLHLDILLGYILIIVRLHLRERIQVYSHISE